MAFERAVPVVLGALAVSSGLALLTFDILFSISLAQISERKPLKIVAIASSAAESITVCLLIVLLGRQIRYRNGAHIRDFGHGQKNTYCVAGAAGFFAIFSAAASAVMLGLVRGRLDRSTYAPTKIFGASEAMMDTGGFIVWAIALLSQAAFVTYLVLLQRREFQQRIPPYLPDMESGRSSEMQETGTPIGLGIDQGIQNIEKASMETPPSSSGRSRSDTINSIRSSFSQGIRPSTSKTKLINPRSPYRATSLESPRAFTGPMEDGFDSWDTSAVDAHARQAVESVSPTPPRFLETIPASPTGSRSPSPGFPLDLQSPKKTKRRSRSYSPGYNQREPRSTRATSPETSGPEAHIHPLFRSDSPTPPPPMSAATVVTAAPGAGLVISDRNSIRTIQRMRSGSLPSSPLVHSASLDSIRFALEREDRARAECGSGERTLTPPIPDFILNGRNSMTGYLTRKASGGLSKVGEVQEI